MLETLRDCVSRICERFSREQLLHGEPHKAYSGADPELIQESRRFVLAMVAAWRRDTDDQFPSGAKASRTLVRALRAGPPWPTLDVVMNQVT